MFEEQSIIHEAVGYQLIQIVSLLMPPPSPLLYVKKYQWLLVRGEQSQLTGSCQLKS